jgi:hypothetical protein
LAILNQRSKGRQLGFATGYRGRQPRFPQNAERVRHQRLATELNQRFVRAHAAGSSSGKNKPHSVFPRFVQTSFVRPTP